MSIVISGKALGSRRPLFADWSIPLPPDDFGAGSGVTLRRLIAIVVEAEREAYIQRSEARRLDRVLSRAQIEQGEQAGKISPEGRAAPEAPSLERSIATAIEAFQDGLYLVIIDEREHRQLDEAVRLTPNSRVVFLRLTFLAGG